MAQGMRGWFPPSGGSWQPPGTIKPFQSGINPSSGSGIFQTQVYYQPAVATEGDFCDHNPRTTVNAGPGGLVAGDPGVIVGRFAWFDPDSPLDPNEAPRTVLSYSGEYDMTTGAFTPNPQPVVGFVHRHQQGLITSWLGGAAMYVPVGFMITLHQTGGFFVRNAGDARAELGMKAFAYVNDGRIAFAAAGGAPPPDPDTGAPAVETKWFATSQGDPGVLIKMSSWPLG